MRPPAKAGLSLSLTATSATDQRPILLPVTSVSHARWGELWIVIAAILGLRTGRFVPGRDIAALPTSLRVGVVSQGSCPAGQAEVPISSGSANAVGGLTL